VGAKAAPIERNALNAVTHVFCGPARFATTLTFDAEFVFAASLSALAAVAQIRQQVDAAVLAGGQVVDAAALTFDAALELGTARVAVAAGLVVFHHVDAGVVAQCFAFCAGAFAVDARLGVDAACVTLAAVFGG